MFAGQESVNIYIYILIYCGDSADTALAWVTAAKVMAGAMEQILNNLRKLAQDKLKISFVHLQDKLAMGLECFWKIGKKLPR